MAWAFGREVGKVTTGASATSQAVTLTAGASVPVGNVVVVWVASNGGTINTNGVTDSKSNAWSVVVNLQEAFVTSLAIAWCTLTNAWTNTDTVTVNCSTAGSLTQRVYVADFAPPAGMIVSLDKSASAATATSTSYSSGATAATTGTDDLLIGGLGMDSTGTNTPGAQTPSWATTTTDPIVQNSGDLYMHYALDAAGGAARTYTGTLGAANNNAAGIVALSAAPIPLPTQSNVRATMKARLY